MRMHDQANQRVRTYALCMGRRIVMSQLPTT